MSVCALCGQQVKDKRPRRSHEQNRYLWGVCYRIVLQHLPGWDADDVHEYFLGEHFGWETLEGLGRKRLRAVRRSSRLSVTEFTEFVAFIQRTMAERGVIIPDPGEVIEAETGG
jgi:hypothetical protein